MLGWGSTLFFQFPFSLLSPAYLHGSWSLFCFAIGSDSIEASGSGRTGGESDSLVVVVEEFASEAEDDTGAKVLYGAPGRAPLPADLRVPPEASSSALPVGAPPFDPSTSVSWGPTSGA